MTIAAPPKPSPRSRSHTRRSRPRVRHEGSAERTVLGRYTDHAGRPREIVVRSGHAGSVLVLDRDARTLEDRRLVAHLGPDEPFGNAELVCRHYLSDPRGRWCRAVSPEDLRAPSSSASLSAEPSTTLAHEQLVDRDTDHLAWTASQLCDRHGRTYWLGFVRDRLSIPELRWLCTASGASREECRPLSAREVVASLESYEPVRAHTIGALRRHRDDPKISVAVLRAELERMDASHIVLNRALRHAVLRAVRIQGMSMSEIALRCGRVKYDARGNASGETSWLARRVGISPEGGEREPTPWVHSDVLALIARAGLGISPREVELG
jgi:hypothetical protein